VFNVPLLSLDVATVAGGGSKRVACGSVLPVGLDCFRASNVVERCRLVNRFGDTAWLLGEILSSMGWLELLKLLDIGVIRVAANVAGIVVGVASRSCVGVGVEAAGSAVEAFVANAAVAAEIKCLIRLPGGDLTGGPAL
jgi:hypothetical protein